jgi:hypothetical protein
MADWVTISALATASGTLVLAAATFASVRSANRAARVAERSLLLGLRPVLVPSRPEDPSERVTFLDRGFSVPGGTAHVEEADGRFYLAIPLRNVGSGLAVLHGWHLRPGLKLAAEGHADPSDFRLLQRDLYVAAGDTGYWQGAIRDAGDPLREGLAEVVAERGRIAVDVLYGDHEGGQRTISRFAVGGGEGDDGGGDDDVEWSVTVVRHWRLGAADPRTGEI